MRLRAGTAFPIPRNKIIGPGHPNNRYILGLGTPKYLLNNDNDIFWDWAPQNILGFGTPKYLLNNDNDINIIKIII